MLHLLNSLFSYSVPFLCNILVISWSVLFCHFFCTTMFILSCYTVNSFTQLSSDWILVYLHYGLFLCLVAVLCTTVHLLLYLFCYLWFIVESTSSYFNVTFDWNWLIDLTMNWYLTHIISSSSLLYILYVLCLKHEIYSAPNCVLQQGDSQLFPVSI